MPGESPLEVRSRCQDKDEHEGIPGDMVCLENRQQCCPEVVVDETEEEVVELIPELSEIFQGDDTDECGQCQENGPDYSPDLIRQSFDVFRIRRPR